MKYKINNNKVFISLETGDEIIESITNVLKIEKIYSGMINGIGAISQVELGFYNIESKEYKKESFNYDYELTSLMGNITLKDEVPFVHIHINMSDDNFKVSGGHLFSAVTAATAEVIILLNEQTIKRELDKNVGLYLWDFNCG
jgi:predicted DNA-binding protein with PD1-like motif